MSSTNGVSCDKMFSFLPETLVSLVTQRFAAARQAGKLVFSHTEVTTIRPSKVPFQLRYCPALTKKPNPEPSRENKQPQGDPFESPSADLLIAEVPQFDSTHILVLNKFPVIPNHFILATKQNKPQTDLLESEDLRVTYSCLKEWETLNGSEPAKRLFAFFNSGKHSGASQPHRHLQFLPVESMLQPDDKLNWAPLIDRPLDGGHTSWNVDNPRPLDLPFTCYAVDLPQDPTADELHRTYLSLYRMATAAANGPPVASQSDATESAAVQTDGPAEISYNLALTTSRMLICPRRSEHAWIQLDENSKNAVFDEGLVKLNGTILAGSLMVKAESEWFALQNNPMMLESVLQTVGVPWSVASPSRT